MATSNEVNTTDKGLATICDGSAFDPFSTENNGTAKFLGSTGAHKFDFHTMKSANPTSKRSLRSEFSKNELLNMLCFLEGELQARDVVIAALRNERVKQLIHAIQTKSIPLNDPYAALFRDKAAASGNLVSRQSSANAVHAETEVRAVIEQEMDSLYQMVAKQRATQLRMIKVLTESLENNQKMRQELEEEKRKHERDTAQGDDITYGLEMERTKLKQELEMERNNRKKLEKDLKKLQETLDFERERQKQIVLLLLAERKKITTKYVEERKRSEDLAQILSEEKQRSDTIAEGLEEESKKSLRMEAELEKQTLSIENERKAMKLNLAKEEKRIKELEMELTQLRIENEAFRKQSVPLRMQSSHNVPVPTLPAKSRSISDDTSAAAPSSMVNVAKIVQPTATVSSVPVSGPTTGIARSISPGQSLRQQATLPNEATSSVGYAAPPAKVTPRKLSNPTSSSGITSVSLVQQQQQQPSSPSPIPSLASTVDLSQNTAHINQTSPVVQSITSQSAIPISTLGKVPSTLTQLSATSASSLSISQQQTATILRNTVTSGLIGSATQASGLLSSTSVVASTIGGGSSAVSSSVTGSRGVPPPIPPNKPIVPPKREPSISRLGSITTNISSNTTS